MRSMAMPVGLFLCRTMRMSVIMTMAVTIAIRNRLRHRMATRVTFVAMAMIVIMTVSWPRIHRLRNSALFTGLCCFGSFIVMLSTTSFSMGNEAFERWLVHVTGQRNTGVAHAQRSRILRLLLHGCSFCREVVICP